MLRKLAVNLGTSVLTIAVLVAVIELTLRLSGFSFQLYPEEIEFGQPDPVTLKAGFLEDDTVYWVTRDYPEKLEQLREVRPKLVFMGDSCTQFGHYDQSLMAALEGRAGRSIPYGNLAVAGWTSYQGLQQLQRDVVPLRPEIVTIYYGWNDHWIGFGIEDKTVARIKALFSSRVSHLRLAQLMSKSWVAYGQRQTAYPNRVSRDDFRNNLEKMVEVARQNGIEPVLLTAPSSHRRGEEPEYLAERWLRDLEDLVPLHQSYVEIVRQVAADAETALCDLQMLFADAPPEITTSSFMADGIHFTPAGSEQVALFLEACLDENGLSQRLTQGLSDPA